MPTTARRQAQVEFGNRVRRFRQALSSRLGRGVSQEDLAERSGLHRTYIGHIERGEVNLALYNILRIAAALEVDPASLVEGLKP
ncbi:MAG TPA: helix-turn-helix transcriptional regulator [Acidimicrobiales bacterium]|nr:helix-turn-helix transcriptional regulator [Acidimicrobiales bacterium]